MLLTNLIEIAALLSCVKQAMNNIEVYKRTLDIKIKLLYPTLSKYSIIIHNLLLPKYEYLFVSYITSHTVEQLYS
jgi:hypothetical protein